MITGATRGLGRALARWAADAGHTVYGCGRNGGNVAAVAGDFGAPHNFQCVDVADCRAVEEWVAGIFAGGGPQPTRIVHNAGLINRNAPLWEVPPEEFSAVVDVNLKGTYHVLRAAVPHLSRNGGGVLVNFSSGWGRSVARDVAAYCGTKWAVEGLTKALAEELPEGVAAYALNPGVIDTEMLRSCFGDGAASMPDPAGWAEKAGPFIEGLSQKQGAVSVSV